MNMLILFMFFLVLALGSVEAVLDVAVETKDLEGVVIIPTEEGAEAGVGNFSATDPPYLFNNDTTIFFNETFLNITIDNRVVAVSDTNETVRFSNLVDGDCTSAEKAIGVQENGTILCDTDQGGTSKGGGIPFLFNDSSDIFFNDTKGNETYVTQFGDTVTGDYNFNNTLFIDADDKEVCIGCVDPFADLHLVGNSSEGEILVTPDQSFSGGDARIKLCEDDDGSFCMYWEYDGGTNDMYLYSKVSSTITGPHISVQRATGQVGIGIITALFPLHVNGSARIETDLTIGDDLVVTDDAEVGGLFGIGKTPTIELDVIGSGTSFLGNNSAIGASVDNKRKLNILSEGYGGFFNYGIFINSDEFGDGGVSTGNIAFRASSVSKATSGTSNSLLGYFGGAQVQGNGDVFEIIGMNPQASFTTGSADVTFIIGVEAEANKISGSGTVNSVIGVLSRNPIVSDSPPPNNVWSANFLGDVQISTSKKLIFQGNETNKGNISIVFDSTNLVFDTNGSDINGLAFFTGSVSAGEYITRTSVFDKSRGSALDFIKDADFYTDLSGEILHDRFYGYTSYPVVDYSRPVIIKETHEVLDLSTDQMIKVTLNRTTYPHTQIEEGVVLDNEIDVLRQAVFELQQRIEVLENA